MRLDRPIHAIELPSSPGDSSDENLAPFELRGGPHCSPHLIPISQILTQN